MAKLLYIESSPQKERSASITVAKKFLETYGRTNPNDTIETIDLWSYPLPEFDGETIAAKYRILHGQEHTDSQAAAWEKVVEICDRFKTAQKFLFSVPMWNFGIPYKLKHFIDILTQPGLTFSFSPETGYSGLVTGKPATVIYARGGEYSSNATVKALDFQKPYVELWLGFIGFTDVHSILVEPTLTDPETVGKITTAALDLAKVNAADF